METHASARWSRRQALAGVASLALGTRAFAQVPDRTGRIVTGFPAGAGSDPIVRLVADKLRGRYLSALIVENKPGAGGRLAIETVRLAPADGGTILFSPASPITLFPSVYRKLSYDPQGDFTPVGTVYSTQLGFIVGPGAPVKSLAEYLEWLQKNPKGGSYGSMGNGTMPHFLGAMFQRESKADLVHVPYKGMGPLSLDLLSGQVPASFSPIGQDAVERHRTGKARILAVASETRMKNLPEVPTFAELGYRNVAVQEWFGLFVPAKTPREQVQALAAALDEVLKEPELVALLERSQSMPLRSTPTQLAERIRTETAWWQGVVRTTRFTPED